MHVCVSPCGVDGGVVFMPGVPGFPPGASWGAVTRSPRRKPGDTGWQAFPCAMRCGFEPGHCVPSSGVDGGVVFMPGVPGFPPGASWGAVTRSPRRKPGDTGSQAFPCAMRCGFEPGNCVPSSGMDGGVVFMPGVPGFPPGASWPHAGPTPGMTAADSRVAAGRYTPRAAE
jgi:hypothetical protein